MRFMKSLEPLALLALRWVLALIFLFHGYPKLVRPTEGIREFFIAHGLPGYFVSLSGILECFGALLLFLGIFTRAGALLLTIEMAVALWKVHSEHGILAVNNYEFPLAVAAACFALAAIGAGKLSLDHLIFGEHPRKRRFAKAG
jgi:putative oxidoreductase